MSAILTLTDATGGVVTHDLNTTCLVITFPDGTIIDPIPAAGVVLSCPPASDEFRACGGTAPYSWSIVTGDTTKFSIVGPSNLPTVFITNVADCHTLWQSHLLLTDNAGRTYEIKIQTVGV